MRTVKAIAAFLVALSMSFSTWTRASTWTSEITDMWWNPAESGWGLNVVLQADVAFATFFIYDAARNPVWYTAPLNLEHNELVWSGNLYATKGPWFGGPFDPATVLVRPAGTARLQMLDLGRIAFSYSVDGVTVSKTLERQTWATEDYSGTYAGGYSIRASGCSPSSLNGITEVAGYLSVSHSGSTVSMASTSSLGSCNFSGAYAQYGKLGTVAGNYTCSSGERGTFQMYEMTPTISGFTGRVDGANQYCARWSGYVGGISRAP
jgi:hypothetical protein